MEQTAALADALRPTDQVGLSVKYTAPTDERFALDTLTEDQLDPYGEEFRDWWHRKAKQIQEAIRLHRLHREGEPEDNRAPRTSATTTVTAPTVSPPRSNRSA